MQSTRASLGIEDVVRRARIRLVLAAGLLLCLALTALLFARLARVEWAWHSAAVAQPEDLPAAPRDIERHGAMARSLLPAEDARRMNAAVPLPTIPLTAARPFRFRGSEEDRRLALQCLATAVLYEAGDDTVGQAAVAQVVLNRVRHPAFPGTICGVVYQGAQRSTGCQFTFTCDGSLRRAMSEAAWRRAREVADRALSGHVDESVGLATHYHTDWVYPYWSPALTKLARVGTHLFFGWPGSWGGPAAFRKAYRGAERQPSLLAGALPDRQAGVEPEERTGADSPQAPARSSSGTEAVPLYGAHLRLSRADGRAFGLYAPPELASTHLVNAALALCDKPGPCQVLAWSNDQEVPAGYPVAPAAADRKVFEYVRGSGDERGSVRFDCARFPVRNSALCIDAAPRRAPAALSGVRWKSD